MRLVCPWGNEVRTESCDQQDGNVFDPTDEEVEQL